MKSMEEDRRPSAPRRRNPKGVQWGRRKRRLRQVVWTLVGLAAAGAALGVWLYLASRPETRRPGEELPEITRKLARELPEDAPLPRFTEVTAEAGLGDFRTFAGPRSSQLPEDMGSGAAWGDFDDDGDDDLFVVAAGGALDLPADERAPSRLYENLGDGTFRRRDDFPATRILGMAAAWGDYDGDGRLDLAVTGYGSLLLFRNTPDGFMRSPALPELPGYWAGLAWGDYDADGDLDLYVCGYVQYREEAGGARRTSQQYGQAVPYTLNPATYEPERNLLFENRGDAGFTEVAQLLGVSNPEGRSLSALWHDFDDDGRLDLYVANDISDNALYLNRVGGFEDAGLSAWVADYRGAMGLAAGDWNRDGDDDLFVTHWIAQENALYDSRWIETRGAAEGASPGRTVPLSFTDRAAPLGLGQIALQLIGWGTEFADFDGDGWLDLVVANGSTFETDDEPPRLEPQPALLLWNRRGEHFHDLAPLDAALSTPHVGRGLALSDYDLDGDLDILMVQHGEGVQLLRNDMQTGRWLKLRLRGRSGGRGEGSTVTVVTPEAALRRSVTGASYLSESSRTLHFGLGETGGPLTAEVRWPGGERQSFGALEPGFTWELVEGEPLPRRLGAAGAASSRETLLAFWEAQRAAMDAMKIDRDLPRAIELFRRALELDPSHEDSRYYLANCLAELGEVDAALEQLAALRLANPASHRGHKQWAVLRAVSAASPADLEAAEQALERALQVNQEETGALLVLGEIALLRGDGALAERRLEAVCRTNPRAVGGFYLRGYLAWKRGDRAQAQAMLAAARGARGEDWKPEGAVAEGDVAARMHREETPLAPYWRSWDGGAEPAAAYAGLDAFLRRPFKTPD